jgi:uncharacterized protein
MRIDLQFIPAHKSFRLLKRHYVIERNGMAVVYNIPFNRIFLLSPDEWSWCMSLPKTFDRNSLHSIIVSGHQHVIDESGCVELLRTLYAQNMIVDGSFDETKYILSRHEFSREPRVHITTLTILPTMRCNFNCDYCVLKHHSVIGDLPDIDTGTAEKAIRLFLSQSHDKLSEHKRILFLGGEPLLRFDVIRGLTDYAISLSDEYEIQRPSFAISTNGYLLNRSMIEFLSANSFHVALSVDDIPTANSGDGSPMKCSRRVLEKISMLNESGHPFAMSITINRNNYRKLSTILDFYHRKHAVDRIVLNLPIGYDPDKDCQGMDHSLLMDSLRSFYDYAVDKGIHEFELNRRVLQLEKDVSALGKNCVACGHQVVLRPDGIIFPCPAYASTNKNAIPLPESFDDLKQNKIWMKWSRRQHLRHKSCVRHCNCISYCTQGCPYHSDMINDNIDAPYRLICDFNRLIMPYILARYADNHLKGNIDI